MRRIILCLMVSLLTPFAYGVSAQGQLPPCLGSYNAETWTKCVGTIAFPNGAKYVGEWKDDKANGQGIEYRTDGSILRSGFWENWNFVGSKPTTTKSVETGNESPTAKKLRELKSLLDQKLITEEDYSEKKKDILKDM